MYKSTSTRVHVQEYKYLIKLETLIQVLVHDDF